VSRVVSTFVDAQREIGRDSETSPRMATQQA
jgi:hypothetical protein